MQTTCSSIRVRQLDGDVPPKAVSCSLTGDEMVATLQLTQCALTEIPSGDNIHSSQ